MNDIPRQYDLIVTNSLPEKEFVKKFGEDLFENLRKEAFILDKGRCAGCGHEPPQNKKKDTLSLHIYEFNEKAPELSKGITLCKMCHLTQHINSAVKLKWILFANSIYNQNRLIQMTRGGAQISEAKERKEIIQLKKTPEQFLKELISGESKLTSTIKVIFTDNFNCYEDL